jgi:hypothetical protein
LKIKENINISEYISTLKYINVEFKGFWEDIDPFGMVEYNNCLFIVSTDNNESFYLRYEQYVYRGVLKKCEFNLSLDITKNLIARLKKNQYIKYDNDISIECHKQKYSIISKISNF